MSSELLFLGGALLGLLIGLGLGLRTSISMSVLGLAPAGLAVLSLVVLVATYKDEFCDEDTACRLLVPPSFLVLTAVAPGMAAGAIVTSAWRRRRALQRRSGSEVGGDP